MTKWYQYQSQDLSSKERHKILTGALAPRPIAWVSSLNQTGEVLNLAPFSFTSVAAKELPLLSLSVLPNAQGQRKDTSRNIVQRKEAVIHVVDENAIEAMNTSSSSLDPDESELNLIDAATIPSDYISVPGINLSPLRMECRLYQHHPMEDYEGNLIGDLFLLEVLAIHLSEHIYDPETGYINYDNYSPVGRLAGNLYSNITPPYTLKRPE